MATIVTRAGKGSPLTHAEVDANFNNLNSDKAETSALGTAAYAATTDFAAAAHTHTLSDITDAGTAAAAATTDFATAAQGANADTAYGWGDHAAAGYTDEALALAIALG